MADGRTSEKFGLVLGAMLSGLSRLQPRLNLLTSSNVNTAQASRSEARLQSMFLASENLIGAAVGL
ncbi:MAG: hypothetical protein ACLPTZ_12750, partial [Beijerinckiaceae bacterium]